MRRFERTCGALLCACALLAWSAAGASAAGSPGAAAWGSNDAGQLGDATLTGSPDPTPVSGLTEVTSVAAGKDHALALLSSGKVMAWGDNVNGELGDGNTTSSEVPVEVKGIADAVAVAAGGEFSLALLENGTVMAWGSNGEGQLGEGRNHITSSDVPVQVKGLSEVTAIAAGQKHGLALLKDGEVMAWGSDNDGQLGNGTTAPELEPVEVSELSGVKAIAAGGLSSYAVLSDGTVEAWGGNGEGQLGNGSTTSSDVPVAVKGVVGAEAVASGSQFALALTSSETVYAWGAAKQGQLGNGGDTKADEAVQVGSLSEVTAIAAGGAFGMALLRNGTIDSWGANSEGELGNGGTTSSDTPAPIPNIDEVKGIAAGATFALAYGPELPTVTSLTPSSGPANGETEVVIAGTGFSGVKSVHFGSTSVAYTVESTTTIHAKAPAGSGAVNVTVTVAGGTSPAAAANRYSYTPVVTAVSPTSGPQEGGTEVSISGLNMSGVSAVKFGANEATSFKDISSTEVKAVSPSGVGTVDITLTGPGGTSEAVTASEFTYGSSAPELGRCVKAGGKKHKGAAGAWSDHACTVAASEGGKFEWEPGPGPKSSSFKVQAKEAYLENGDGRPVICKRVKGTGEYSGARALKDVALKLENCREEHNECSSAKAAEGEIAATLAGLVGVIQKAPLPTEDKLGLELTGSASSVMFEFKCGSTSYVWRGSMIAPVRADKMEKIRSLAFAAAKGHEKVERFEGGSLDVPEASMNGGAYVQGAITVAPELRARAELEINSVH